MVDSAALPLAGVRVVELTGGCRELTGRLLGDLGADVHVVEPPEGSPSRRRGRIVDGVSIPFAVGNVGKTSISADLADPHDRARVLALIGSADIVIDTLGPGGLQRRGLDPAVLVELFPTLVIASLSAFGADGPYAGYRDSGAVLAALTGFLARSGMPGRPPVLPPEQVILAAADIEAVWDILVAYRQRLRTGVGDHLDFSAHEAVLRVMDPAIAYTGAESAGNSLVTFSHGRTDESYRYPVFASADAPVRICVLSPPQWRSLRAWLGDPDELMDAELESTFHRYRRWDEIAPHVARLFAGETAAALVAEAKRRSIPMAVLADTGDVLDDPHFRDRGVFTSIALGERGAAGLLPAGFFEIDGVRVGPRGSVPALGADAAIVSDDVASAHELAAARLESPDRLPLDGLRVIDLGVIIAGAELGRVFAEQGADVVKVESSAYPDADRLTAQGLEMSTAFAARQRGKRSVGLNLRDPEGRALLLDLVRQADLVCSNFKPGTMERLGLGEDALRAVNPSIIIVESSALGSWGRRADEMGYGPLVRATTSLTARWRDAEDGGLCDSFSAYPDHLVARLCAIGGLALLLRRDRTTRGGTLSLAHAEAVLNVLAEDFVAASVSGAGEIVDRPRASLVLRCAGDDQWCAVSLEEGDLSRLGSLLGVDVAADDAEQVARLRAWALERDPHGVMRQLQAAGIAAGAMVRPMELPEDAHLVARSYIAHEEQPGLEHALPVPARLFQSLRFPPLHQAAAPRQFEHTRQVLQEVLGLEPAAIDELVARGITEVNAQLDERIRSS